jgi:hypothetical protein
MTAGAWKSPLAATAMDAAGLKIGDIRQLAISEKIRHLLTEASYRLVRRRYQIAIFKMLKPDGA